MSSKRVPLANNPNAANSPFRVPALAAKRSRAQALDTKDAENVFSPPKKKQLLGIEVNGTRRAQHISPDDREGKVFLGKTDTTSTNAFTKKLTAAARTSRHERYQLNEKGQIKLTGTTDEQVKQWRKHYRRAFPTFVFYFESLPADVASRSSKQIAALGAREEKFFSKSITHIVTARAVPPSPEQENGNARGGQATQKTINPSLLERGTDVLAHVLQRGSRNTGDVNGSKTRQGGHTDVLQKARELGIKIWALEKFERMMDTMFDIDTGEEEEYASRKTRTLDRHDPNLSQLLRHEKERHAEAERPAYGDIVPFRGYFIYIHDMNERMKPVMVREYKTVQHKDEGEWPQFRSVPLPRCPFVEDPTMARREAKEEERRNRERGVEAELARAQRQQPRTRAAAATIEAARGKDQNEEVIELMVKDSGLDTNQTSQQMPIAIPTKTFEPPAVKRTGTTTSIDSMPPHMTSARLNVNARPGHEPMASGLQQANVTSAIRSQMISSTAACPTVRAGTGKDILQHQQLQRRAVERRSNLSTASVPSVTDVRAAINNEQTAASRRPTRRKPELTKIHEDEDEDEHSRRAPKERVAIQRDPKPGYCENCRDKYDDFNEHIESRKHRKFAMSNDNWFELDDLLKRLVRK